MEQQNWFYRKDEQQIGPVSRDEILRLITQQALTGESYVWAEGMENWQRLESIPDLAAFIPAGQGRQRPKCVKVLGILNIIFGGLALLCSPLGIISLLIPQPNSPFQLTPEMKLLSLVGYGVGFIASIVLLASGIGLLNLRKWARQTAYIYGWFAIVWGILSSIANGIMFSSSLSGASPEEMPIVIGGIASGMCGGLVGLIYPVILIIFLRKPRVIAACDK